VVNNILIYPRVYYINVDNTVNPREEKGKQIASDHNVFRISDYHYKVHSQSKRTYYEITRSDNVWRCTCPDHIYRHVCCKHIHAVEYSIKIRDEVRKQNQITIEPVNASICPQCKSDRIVKHGVRHNKHGDIQRYSCKSCHNRFIVNIGFEKMGATPQSITSAMQLYFTGESLRSVQKFLKLQGVDVSHMTIYNWITKYTKLMKGYLDKITPQVGDTWRSDELFVKINGNMKYLYALMDDETRFWIASQVANTKFKEDIGKLFQDGKETAQKKPRVLITDGAKNFHQACMREFWARPMNERTIHIQHIHFKHDMNNNKMERMNGEFRDREKVMRGIKKDDSVMFEGYQMFHNYIRPHMGLDGLTPAEKCGIKIGGNNKWVTLIQNAKTYNNIL